MAEETTEESTEDTTSLEDTEISFGDTEEESDEAETTEDTQEDEPEEEAESESETEEESTDEPEEPEAPKTDKEIKAFNKEQAEKRVQAKAEREAQLRKQQQDYIAEADTEDPRDLAVRQLQVDAYNNKVDGNTNKLTNGYERAIKDFDVLTDKNPEIQSEVDSALDAFQAMYVTVDEYGNPTDVRGDLYQYLQAKADSITRLTGIGATKQLRSKDKEKSKVLATPTRAPKPAKRDSDIDAFDEEAARW